MQLLDLNVRQIIPLLIITSVILGDTLILKDKSVYNGTFIKYDNDKIIFKVLSSAKLSINISDMQELKLSDGKKVVENGIIVESEEKHIIDIKDDSYLSTVQAEEARHKFNFNDIYGKIIQNMNDKSCISFSWVGFGVRKYDTLVLYNGDVFKGKYEIVDHNSLYFITSIDTTKKLIPFGQIRILREADGNVMIYNGVYIANSSEKKLLNNICGVVCGGGCIVTGYLVIKGLSWLLDQLRRIDGPLIRL